MHTVLYTPHAHTVHHMHTQYSTPHAHTVQYTPHAHTVHHMHTQYSTPHAHTVQHTTCTHSTVHAHTLQYTTCTHSHYKLAIISQGIASPKTAAGCLLVLWSRVRIIEGLDNWGWTVLPYSMCVRMYISTYVRIYVLPHSMCVSTV